MFVRKLLAQSIIALILLILASPHPAFAEVKEIIAEGTYIMGDGETPTVAQERAIVEAKRMAVEQAGTYLESFSEVKNMQLTKDEIKVFASGLIETTILDKKRSFGDNDSIQFWVRVRCLVNPDNIQAMRNKLQDKTAMDTLKQVQSDYEKAMREITELKRKLAKVTSSEDKKLVEARITQNELTFTAVQWNQKGNDYNKKKDYDNAIIAFTKAIELNPEYANAYYNRGLSYDYKSQFDQAISDYNKAIQLNPQHALAYNNRGIIYHDKGQLGEAISDYNKAIQLDPQDEVAYSNRGNVYKDKGQFAQAISDYSKAIQLNPQLKAAYLGRGAAYSMIKQFSLAISDSNKAIELSPQDADSYFVRGFAFAKLERFNEAISSFKLYLLYAPPTDPKISKVKHLLIEIGSL